MRALPIEWGNVVAILYFMDNKDKIPRHSHSLPQLVKGIEGEATVYTFDGSPSIIIRGLTEQAVIGANVDHEVVCHRDGTVILKIIEQGGSTRTPNSGNVSLSEM